MDLILIISLINFPIDIIIKIETIAIMMHNVRFYLPNRLKVERLRVLNSSHGLSELFDRMEAKTPFAVP